VVSSRIITVLKVAVKVECVVAAFTADPRDPAVAAWAALQPSGSGTTNACRLVLSTEAAAAEVLSAAAMRFPSQRGGSSRAVGFCWPAAQRPQ